MTIGVVYRVPGLGAVVGCDGRVTTDDGAILSDCDDKLLAHGSLVSIFAGTYGGLLVDLRVSPPRSWAELRKATIDIDAELSHARSYELLAYDRRTDALWYTDHQGDASRRGLYAAIGCGGAVALGALDALPQARSLELAERAVRRALKIACWRQSACGGRLRVLTVPRRGKLSG